MLAQMPTSKSAIAKPADDARAQIAGRAREKALAQDRKMELYWVVTMVALYLDTMATYFSRTLTGSFFSYAIIILAMFVFGVLLVGYPKFKLPRYGYVAAYLLILSFSVAILSLDEFATRRFRDLTAAIVAFGLGYAVFKSQKTPKLLQNGLFFIGCAYAVVCFIAVAHLYPSLFPVINTLGKRGGEWVMRPEVTTDQNFQIFYLVPIAMVMALENSTLRLFATLVIAAISAYVLSELQTRSGSLVLAATLVLASVVGMRSRGKMDYRLVAIAIIGLFGALLFLDKIMAIFSNLIERFTVSDFDTFEKRGNAFFFTFEHFTDYEWWVPQGYREYRDLTGEGKPHSNITAIFVESGMAGVIGWALAVVLPLIVLGIRWLKKKTDPIADIALCGGASTLVIQLSLNAALNQLVWFWSGAVLAALMRSSSIADAERPPEEASDQVPSRPGAPPVSPPNEGIAQPVPPNGAARPPQHAAAPASESKQRALGLRKLESDSLKRFDTRPLKRPDTKLKRQHLPLKTLPKK